MRTQTRVTRSSRSASSAADRLIVALDVPTLQEATRVVQRVREVARWFKVGSELFTAAGPSAVTMVLERGGQVFLDLKYHDIPRTVASAVGAAVRLGVAMLNVHVAAGEEALRAAVAALAAGPSSTRPRLLGVTRLTSVEDRPAVTAEVIDAAARAKWCGLDGVVASAREAVAIKAACGPEFVVVAPGIRPGGVDAGDQRRVATPAEALRGGADYLVVGRPVVAAVDPGAAIGAILQEMDAVLHQEPHARAGN